MLTSIFAGSGFTGFAAAEVSPQAPDGIPLGYCMGTTEPLDVSGATYYLTGNVSSSGTCFSIQNDSITLDGMGYTITGNISSTSSHYGISAGLNAREDITITNVTIEGYIDNTDPTRNGASAGIRLRSVDGGSISDVTVRNNNNGISLSSIDGIDGSHNITIERLTSTSNEHNGVLIGSGGSYPSNNNTLVDSTISDNGNFGIRIAGGSSGTTIVGNTITNNTEHGIHMSGGSDTEIRGNTVANTKTGNLYGTGIWIGGDASSVEVVDNIVSNNEDVGINLNSISAATVTENNVSANGDDGISLNGVTGTTVSRNNVSANDLNGIWIERDSTGNTVADNIIEQHSSGIFVIGSSGNVFSSNVVRASTNDGIVIRSDDSILDGTVVQESGGNGILVTTADNVSITGAKAIDNGDNGIRLIGGVNHRIQNSTVAGNLQSGIELVETIGATVRETSTHDNMYAGFRITSFWYTADTATNTTLTNVRSTQNGEWAVLLDEGSTNTTVKNLDIGASTAANTTLSFVGEEIGIRAVSTPPTNGDSTTIGRFFDAIEQSEGATLSVDVQYKSSDVTGVDESTLRLWGYSDGAWSELVSTLDTDARTVSGTLSESSTVGLFGEAETGDGDDGTGGDGENGGDDDGVTVTQASLRDTVVDENTLIRVDATVTNSGSTEETAIFWLEVDGVQKTGIEETIGSGETMEIEIAWVAAPAGEYDLTVDGTAAGTLTVVGPEPDRLIIDEPGVYTLDGDLTVSETAVEITSSDVTFDGGGHTIAASNATGSDRGIHVTGGDERIENITVTNVVLEGWDNGVRFRNVDNSELSNLHVENGSTGVLLSASHDNELTNLTIQDNDRRGLSLLYSNNNVVSGVEATGNEASTTFSGRGSVYLFSSSNNVFEDVSVSDGRSGVRISFSSGNEFVGITTERHANYGLEIGSNSNTFTDVVANDNGWHGIELKSASSNSFENVSVTGNDGSAVRLTGIGGSGGPPQYNVFENLSVTDNDGSAVSLSVSNFNTFRNLTTASNTGTAVNFVSRSVGNLVEFGEVGHGSNTAVNFGPDSVGNTIKEVSLRGPGTPFVAQDGAPNNEFDRVDVDGTVVSLSARGVGTYRASPSTLPESATPLDSYLGFTPHSSGTTHVEYLRFHYETVDVDSFDENALAIWRLAGGEWTAPTDATYVTGIDTDQQYVFANGIDESDLSATFGAFAPEPAPQLAVTNTDLSANTILKNDSVTVSADIENVGEVAGDLTVELTIGGEVLNTTTVDLAVGETDSVEFTYTFEAAGQFTVEVGGESAGTVTVIESAEVIVFGASVDRPDHVEPGDTITVTGRLYNTAPVATSEEVALEVDEVAVNQTIANINGTSIKRVELSWTPEESDLNGSDSAEFALTINGFVVETVTVEYRITDIQVIAASVSETELVAGESASVIGSIYQAGNYEGSQTIALTATKNGSTETIGSQEVTLAPGFYHLGAINITTQFEDPGTYELELGGRAAGTIEVEPAYSDIQVIAASPSTDELVAGEELYVIGSIYQAGTIEGSQTIDLTATNTDTNGSAEIVGNQTVTLRPGFYHLGALNVSFAPEEAGTYKLELGGREAGTVEVAAAESDIRVIAASVSDDDVIEDEELYVIGSLYQAGTVEGPQTIDLNATNTDTGAVSTLGSHDVTLTPGIYHLGALNISFRSKRQARMRSHSATDRLEQSKSKPPNPTFKLSLPPRQPANSLLERNSTLLEASTRAEQSTAQRQSTSP